MDHTSFQQLLAYSTTPDALNNTVAYLTDSLHQIIHEGESVLICFPKKDEKGLGSLLEKAILTLGGTPVFWDTDYRWKELLRLAFFSRASTIIGTPLTILGLSKLASFRGVPLFAFNVVLTGYPCLDWMMDGIISGFDCRVWSLLAPKLSSVVAGFSCDRGRGVHLRQDEYDIRIMDKTGKEVPDGTCGAVRLMSKENPDVSIMVNSSAVLLNAPCSCGNSAPKLVDMNYANHAAVSKYRVLEELLYWNSILDCWVNVTEHGIELQVVSLPGLKLPKFPSCARLELHEWNSEEDMPFEVSDYFIRHQKF